MNSYTGERVPIIGKQSEGVKNIFQITLLISANITEILHTTCRSVDVHGKTLISVLMRTGYWILCLCWWGEG